MNIANIRETIRSAGYTRNWLTGGTREEFRRQQVGPAMDREIAALKALEIKPRFAKDAAQRDQEIEYCERVKARWIDAQAVAA